LLGHDDGAYFMAYGYIADLRRPANSRFICQITEQGAQRQLQRVRQKANYYGLIQYRVDNFGLPGNLATQ